MSNEIRVVADEVPAAAQQAQPQQGYVRVYLVDFTFPTRSLARVKTLIDKTRDEEEKREMIKVITMIDARIAAKLETLRRRLYDMMYMRFAHTSIGWIAIDERGVRNVRELNQRLREGIKRILDEEKDMPERLRVKLAEYLESRYQVKAIEVLLKYDDAKSILEKALEELRDGIDELRERLEQAREESRMLAVRRYTLDIRHREELLRSLEEFYKRTFSQG
mgnify:CR=1 FL=1